MLLLILYSVFSCFINICFCKWTSSLVVLFVLSVYLQMCFENMSVYILSGAKLWEYRPLIRIMNREACMLGNARKSMTNVFPFFRSRTRFLNKIIVRCCDDWKRAAETMTVVTAFIARLPLCRHVQCVCQILFVIQIWRPLNSKALFRTLFTRAHSKSGLVFAGWW